jgi:hypothetical protein
VIQKSTAGQCKAWSDVRWCAKAARWVPNNIIIRIIKLELNVIKPLRNVFIIWLLITQLLLLSGRSDIAATLLKVLDSNIGWTSCHCYRIDLLSVFLGECRAMCLPFSSHNLFSWNSVIKTRQIIMLCWSQLTRASDMLICQRDWNVGTKEKFAFWNYFLIL